MSKQTKKDLFWVFFFVVPLIAFPVLVFILEHHKFSQDSQVSTTQLVQVTPTPVTLEPAKVVFDSFEKEQAKYLVVGKLVDRLGEIENRIDKLIVKRVKILVNQTKLMASALNEFDPKRVKYPEIYQQVRKVHEEDKQCVETLTELCREVKRIAEKIKEIKGDRD